MSKSLEGRAEWVRRTIPRGTLFVQGIIQDAKTDEDLKREEKARKYLPDYLLIVPEPRVRVNVRARGHAYLP